MVWLRDSATYWRKRAQYARHCAEYARECAESARSDRSKQKYLKIAKKYDQEADRAGERHEHLHVEFRRGRAGNEPQCEVDPVEPQHTEV